jgi:hypothetical protein
MRRSEIWIGLVVANGVCVDMPEALIIYGLRVVIYPNDHRLWHVHIVGNGCEAVFDLRNAERPIELRENYGFPAAMLGKIATILEMHIAVLCTAWRRIHEFH